MLVIVKSWDDVHVQVPVLESHKHRNICVMPSLKVSVALIEIIVQSYSSETRNNTEPDHCRNINRMHLTLLSEKTCVQVTLKITIDYVGHSWLLILNMQSSETSWTPFLSGKLKCWLYTEPATARPRWIKVPPWEFPGDLKISRGPGKIQGPWIFPGPGNFQDTWKFPGEYVYYTPGKFQGRL